MVFLEELSFVLLGAFLTSNIVLAVIGHCITTPPCIMPPCIDMPQFPSRDSIYPSAHLNVGWPYDLLRPIESDRSNLVPVPELGTPEALAASAFALWETLF